MATMGEALAAFDRMLDETRAWATGSTTYQQITAGGRVLRRDYDFVSACAAFNVARAAIDGEGDEQAAADALMDVVLASQWHFIDSEQGA